MKFLIKEDYEELSSTAADLLTSKIKSTNHCLMTCSTGDSPTLTYKLLCDKILNEKIDMNNLIIHKLDEWVGLANTNKSSCDYYLKENIVNKIGILDKNYWGIDGDSKRLESDCLCMAERLKRNNYSDICILGLGANGHLGFNEPSSFLATDTHVTLLSESSKNHQMINNEDNMINYGVTTGMKEILASKFILLLVNGRHKNKQIEQLKRKEIRTDFPASLLWLHQNVVCICDDLAWNR